MQDGRLQINDQLLCVNDDDLKQKANSEAMEALRQAMHTEGPLPGYIKLKIERKLGSIASNGSTPEPWDSSTTTDSTVTGLSGAPDHMIGSKIPDVTLTQYNERKLSVNSPITPTTLVSPTGVSPTLVVSPRESSVAAPASVIDQMRNPVLDRITGGNANKLR